MESSTAIPCPRCTRLIRIPVDIVEYRDQFGAPFHSVECDMRELWGHVAWHRSPLVRFWSWLTTWR